MEKLLPNRWEKYFVKWGQLVHNSEVFPYAVLNVEAALSVGAPRIFTCIEPNFLGISEEYPEKWMELGILHEIMENFGGVMDQYSCLRSTTREIRIAVSSKFDMKEYIEFRYKFFTDLITFHVSQDKNDNFLIKRLKHSQSYLINLINGPKCKDTECKGMVDTQICIDIHNLNGRPAQNAHPCYICGLLHRDDDLSSTFFTPEGHKFYYDKEPFKIFVKLKDGNEVDQSKLCSVYFA